MNANELADKLDGITWDDKTLDEAATELRTLSSANKWQADRLGKLETLNSWQANEINLFSADLKKSIVELHADSEIALVQKKALEASLKRTDNCLIFSTEQLQQANARIAELHAENEKLNAYANENKANWNYWQLEADKFRLELQRANTSYQDLHTKFGQLYDERYEGCGERDGETYEQIHAELDTANARISELHAENEKINVQLDAMCSWIVQDGKRYSTKETERVREKEEQLQQANARIESLEEELKSKSSFIEILNRENLELMTKYCQTKQRLATYEASTIENLLNNKQFQAEVK